jgi:polysaccharide chain length determinant protein (PEP-CTERM system associated)
MDELSGIDIRAYWKMILVRRYLFIAVALSCLSVIVFGSYLIPKKYEAQCTVLVERNIINALVKDLAITPSLEERLRVLSLTMISRNLIMKVIKDLDLDINKSKGKPIDVELLVKDFQDGTKIKVVDKGGKGTDWFSVTYEDKDPKLARDYVNTLVNRYVEENLSAKKEESYDANKFLFDQRKFFKEKMDVAEDKIMEYRKNQGIYIAVDEKMIVGEIKNAEGNLETLKYQRIELEAKKNMNAKQLKEEKPYTVALFGKSKGGTVNERILMLQDKFNELLLKYTENYPEVIKVRAELEMLKKQALESKTPDENVTGNETEMSTLNPSYQKIKEELGKVDIELAALSAKEKHQRELIESKKEYLKNIPLEKKTLADLEREKDTYKQIDDALVLKLGQSEVSKQMEIQDKTETFRIIDPAILPTRPVSPNRVLIMLLGIAAGIGAGFGTVILLNHHDRSIKTVDELTKAFHIPVLAVIPQIVTENDMENIKSKDRKVYAFSIAYLSIICILIIIEAIKIRH